MSRIRVHELAKELNKSSKDIIYALKSHGVVVESHMSTISAENADKIRRYFSPAARAAARQDARTQQPAGARPDGRVVRPDGAQATRSYTGEDGRRTGVRMRPAGERPRRVDGERQGVRSDGERQGIRGDGERFGYRGERRDGMARPVGERPRRVDGERQGVRSDGERQGIRGDGERFGYRGERRDGMVRPAGERPRRSEGDRQNLRAESERPNVSVGSEQPFVRTEDGRQTVGGESERREERQVVRADGAQREERQTAGADGAQREERQVVRAEGERREERQTVRADGAQREERQAVRAEGERREDRQAVRADGERREERQNFRRDGERRENRQGYRGDRDRQGGRPGTRGDGERREERQSYRGEGNARGDGDRGYRGDRDRQGGYRGDRRDGGRPYGDRDQSGRGDGRGFNGQNRQDDRRGQAQGYDRGRNAGRDQSGRNVGRDQSGRSGARDQGSRDGGRNFTRDNRGRGGRDQKFNLDSAISKEVVASKDATRENRRNFKDKGARDKNTRDRENEKRLNRGSEKNTVSKKPAVSKPAKPKPVEEKVREIVLPESITLKELGDKMKVNPSEIIKKLFLGGKMVTLNSEISYDEAEEIAMDYDILCEHEVVVDAIEELLKEDEEREDEMVTRPPVVCVMGHVDHGKTSILDAIRQTRVTAGEAGGITQHIGAYVVDVKGQKITFLDTPGHEAFTAMRLRGAQSTDIAILVVAADDGVMPQTVEAINHARAAGIEIIVAINKIDKPSANIDRVKQELTEHDLVAEDWGGQTIMVPVSAHTKEGLDELLDMILLVAEMRELKANPNRRARGLVLEAQLDKGRGPVATVLVQKGTLNVGDNVAVGTAYGRVRAMIDDTGRRVKSATPSMPVEILGLNDVPQAGEVFVATENEKEARAFAETFIAKNREKLIADTKSKLSLEGLFDQIQAGQVKELNIVVKADVQGSVEALKQSLLKLSNDEVAVKVIHGGVGAINESDVMLASASNAIIIGFNVRPDNQAKAHAEAEKVDIRLYRVIYNAIEDVEAAMKGMLEPTFEEKIIGHADVRQTYKVSGVGTIIGGYVTDGKVARNSKARLIRDNVVIYEGELASLKRFKDDVKEVNAGYEFGMSFDKFNDIKEGDKVEVFVMEEVER